jgi:hypothetical protein
MFDPTSRYAGLETNLYVTEDGREIRYVRRRFLPRGRDLELLVEVEVRQSDRTDLIANRTLGNPELFWRICDANDAMDPFELEEEPGRTLRVPLPKV